jgi:hypothetical protein
MMAVLCARALIRPERPWFGWLLTDRLPDWTGPAAADRRLWLFALGCCRRVAPLLAQAVVAAAPEAAGDDPREALRAEEQLLADCRPAGPRPCNRTFYLPVAVSTADHALAAAHYAACDLFNEDPREPEFVRRRSIEPRGGGGVPVVGIRSSIAVRRAVASVTAGRPPEVVGPEWHAAWRNAERVEAASHAALIRCIYGNPFRAAPRLDPAWLAWNGGVVPDLARTIYDASAVDRLPHLADALEDAGCNDAEVLGHLRGPGPHARGCRALDLILGKE